MTVSREEFERRVVTCFKKKGYGYEEVLMIASGVFEETYRAYASEKLAFAEAVGKLTLETDRLGR